MKPSPSGACPLPETTMACSRAQLSKDGGVVRLVNSRLQHFPKLLQKGKLEKTVLLTWFRRFVNRLQMENYTQTYMMQAGARQTRFAHHVHNAWTQLNHSAKTVRPPTDADVTSSRRHNGRISRACKLTQWRKG